MKKIIIFSIVTILSINMLAQKNSFPVIDSKNLKDGELILKDGFSKNKNYKEYSKKIKTSYGTIAVKENRNKKDSRIITLPVKKLHSFSKNPKDPVFLLFGGPGMTNLRTAPFLWLLENHDIVMVGYRGADGQVSLKIAEFPKAMATEGDPFSKDNLKKLGAASLKSFNKLIDEGIDVSAYNMIEVIDDFETARIALGYDKINLFGISYGTRVAYLYGLRYPKSINRSFIEAVNPPGCFVWEPHLIDSLFFDVAKQWKNKPECVSKSPDILKTIENVLSSLPVKWKKVTINPEKVKIMTFMMAYSQKGIVQIFDAFVAAENGDYSGLAFLSMAYDQLPNMEGMNWGDNFSKAVSADYNPEREYLISMDPVGSVIGSPMSKLFGLFKYGGWPMQKIHEEYLSPKVSNVETLMLSGTIDISTPASNGTELLEYLPNGHQVILKNRGHQDMGSFQSDAYHTLVNSFFQSGKVDDSGFTDIEIDFNNVKPSYQKMGKLFYTMKKLGLAKLLM